MSELKASFKQVVAEHRELRRMLEELRRHLERPIAQTTFEESHAWASVLAQQLVKLHDKLLSHFRLEEKAGILAKLAREFPHAAETVSRLQDEHTQVLGEVKGILGDTMTLAEDERRPAHDVSGRTLGLLELLDRHEEKETELIERLFCEELGGGHY